MSKKNRRVWKYNPYKPVIVKPEQFKAVITEELWNQIYDPTMKQRKKNSERTG